MSVRIGWEKLDVLLTDGLADLAIQHWEEAENDHLPLDPDWSRARSLERASIFRGLGVRREADLVGYAYCILTPSLQHRGVLQAYIEALYVEPGERGLGARVLWTLQRLLDEAGVVRSVCASKPHVLLRSNEKEARLGDLLSRMGWTVFETLYSRSKGSGHERRK